MVVADETSEQMADELRCGLGRAAAVSLEAADRRSTQMANALICLHPEALQPNSCSSDQLKLGALCWSGQRAGSGAKSGEIVGSISFLNATDECAVLIPSFRLNQRCARHPVPGVLKLARLVIV